MMRLVLDTNVVVAGLLSEAGPPGLILDLVLSGDLQLTLDNPILREYRDALGRPELDLPGGPVAQFLAAVELFGELITALQWSQPLPDADDEAFLAVAGAVHAILVTGNIRHFPDRIRAGVRVLSPRQFIDFLRG
jgi:putative PIN family toxin of toxin-antitoxin system